METRRAPAPARVRRLADQPSFSSTLLDAICDSMDDPGRAAKASTAANGYGSTRATTTKKQQEAAQLHYYYYKPSLAASHRARAVPTQAGTQADCSGRGYFSSSEFECCSVRRIRTSGSGVAPTQRQQKQQLALEKKVSTKKPTNSARRPASPGARLASLLNSIFTGKRSSAQWKSPVEQETACPGALLANTPPPATMAPPSRRRNTRTVRFLDIDGEVAVAAASVGRCRRIPVVEVEEVPLRPDEAEADTESFGGSESSDGSSDLFELESLGAVVHECVGGRRTSAFLDSLPVYGTTGVGLRRGIGRGRTYEYDLARSCRKVV